MSVNKRTDWGQGSHLSAQKKEVYRNGTPPFGSIENVKPESRYASS